MVIKKIKEILKDNNGFSLFESVVTFALIGVLCTMLVFLITASLNVYNNTKGSADGQKVASIIMEKISGEISSAQCGVKGENSITIFDAGSGTMDSAVKYLDYSDFECIAFTNRDGSPVYITQDDGYLNIHYRPVTDKHLDIKAVDWRFDKKVYQNYKIEELAFHIVKKYSKNTNIISIDLKLKNQSSGYEYSETKYVECYNYEATQVSKISYGLIAAD